MTQELSEEIKIRTSEDKMSVWGIGESLEQVKGYITFPCCASEKKMVYASGRGRVSDKCPRCGKFAMFDLDRMRSWPTGALKGIVCKQNNRKYRPSH